MNNFVYRVTSLLIVGCAASFCQNAQAQTDTSLRNYFPMQIGNYWEYVSIYSPPEPSFRYWIKITGDTVMNNVQTYRIFREKNLEPPQSEFDAGFYRMDDSLQVFFYTPDSSRCPDREYVIYKLTAPDRSVWPVCPYYYRDLQWTSTVYYPNIDLI